MQRRKFITGLGALVTGSAAAMGTGAFTSVTADRQVNVNVADDANAYLGLAPASGSNGVYAEDVGNDKVAVDFNSIDDGASSSGDVSTGGSGVNPDSNTVAKNVLTITNQGTQAVEVSLSGSTGDVMTQDPDSISAPGSDGINASLSTATDQLSGGGGTNDGGGDVEVDPGESVDVDFAINSGTSTLSGSLTIDADASTTNA